MRRSLAAWSGTAAVLVALPTLAAETIVERLDLIDLRWAEVSLASGSGVTIAARASAPGEPSEEKGDEYPFLWRVEFFEGQRRNKTPGELGDEALVQETTRRIGSFYIIGDFAGGRDGAKAYGRALEEHVRRIDLPSLDSEFRQPAPLVESGIRAVDGDARLIFCSDLEGSPSPSGEVKKSGNTLNNTIGLDFKAEECQVVAKRAADAVEFARYRLGYEPLAIIAETVTFEGRSQLDQPPIGELDLVKVEKTPAGPSQGWFNSVDTKDDQTISRETAQLTIEERAAGRVSPSQIVEVRLRNGEMPLEVARGRGAILRFDVERAEKKLGARPRNLASDRWSATVAFFLRDDKLPLNMDRFVELAASEWAQHRGPLSPESISNVAHDQGRDIGGLEMLTVFCPSPAQGPPGALYCVRHGCASITNGPVFCQALESQFRRR